MRVEITLSGEIFEWRGPAPFYFLRIPEEESALIKSIASQVTYGWGVVPAWARIGDTRWKTSLMPKKGRFLLPLKDAVRNAEGLEVDQIIEVEIEI